MYFGLARLDRRYGLDGETDEWAEVEPRRSFSEGVKKLIFSVTGLDIIREEGPWSGLGCERMWWRLEISSRGIKGNKDKVLIVKIYMHW